MASSGSFSYSSINLSLSTALGYKNTRVALQDDVDEEDKGVTKVTTSGGMQDAIIINESGLYALVFGSNLPKAKEFKHWVTSEVLPSIRKTGTYSKKSANSELARIRADAMMLNAKSRMAKQMTELWTAAGVEPQYQALALNNYIDGISLPRNAFKEQTTVLYDATTIAEHLGIMSKSNKPHAQAVTAIISALDVDESERTLTPYSRNGHDGESVQYTLSVEQKVAGWLTDNGYPEFIDGNDKKYAVRYKAR